MTTVDGLTEKQERVLNALRHVSGGTWVEADQVARRANVTAIDMGLPRISAIGAGRILSALADLGYCAKRLDGYMNRYSANVPEAAR